MPESTLSLTRGDLKRHIGRFLGISRDPLQWTAESADDVADIVRAAERMFYFPEVDGKTYVWSFLKKTSVGSLSSGVSTYDLADDFGGFLTNQLTFSTAEKYPLLLVDISLIREKQQHARPVSVNQPLLAAVTPSGFSPNATGQRWKLTVWPTPTQGYVIYGDYRTNVDAISDDTHYPLGSGPHAQTLLEAALASAELYLNDQPGPHNEMFKRLLAASVQYDQGLNKRPEM